MGLVMVAQLICQAKVASLQVGKTCLALKEIRRCQKYAISLKFLGNLQSRAKFSKEDFMLAASINIPFRIFQKDILANSFIQNNWIGDST